MKDIPVILICYNRPKHTLEVLRALKQHDVKNIYIFSDAPKRQEDVEALSLVRRLVHSIDWTKPKIIERTKNLGLAGNIVTAVDYVFEKYDRLILLEDDCVPQRYFFDFMHTCLEKYENNPKVFGISGYTVAIPDEILRSYPYDLYSCPRIGSWGWATWKRAWQHYEKDLRKLVKIANERNADLTQGGTDIPISIEKFLKGQLKDVWTLNWVLSVYINGGVYIYPTRSHIRNIGMDSTGLHCGKTDKYDSPCSNIRPTRYPADIFLDERIMENFKSYYTAAPQRSRRAVHFLKSLRQKKPLKIAQISTVDKKGGAARVAWMLKEGLKDRGLQTKMFVKERFSEDSDVQTITKPAIDGGDDYRSRGFLYYDINSTFLLSRNNDFISSDIFHFHNLHGDYFNPFALPELTKIRPSVWTLHDMQSMTGHCAYAFDCPRWQSGCGDCPHLESYPAVTIDRTARMWEDKRRIYQKSDIELIVPSQWMKDVVEKSILKDKRVHLIYNGVDERIYRPYDKYAARKKLHIPDNSIVLGFVSHKGLNDRRKGGNFILEAYKYFTAKYPNAFFICVGGTSDKAPTERFLQIPFLLDEEKLVQLYCASDIFLFPTLVDNCPLVILEVMGCGVPIVSFNTGGVPELIEHGKTGLIAELKNSEEFIKMAEHLIANRAKREEFGAAGRERLLKMFTLEQMIDKHIALYERLAKQGKKKNYVLPKNKVAMSAAAGEKQYKYLVSAIVSTYNSEKHIRGCLEDLESQTIADKLEIIVVNSGSKQNEEAIVREFQSRYDNIKYIRTEERETIYKAWNRAIKAASGKYIANANTDDRHRKDALEIMVSTLQANPDIALVYGDQIRTETPNDTFENHHGTQMDRRPEYSRERLLFGCCVGSQPMWRKSLHNELGYFDESLACSGDWDFWLRVSSRYKFKHITEFLGLYYYNREGIEHGRRIHSWYERYMVGRRYGTEYIRIFHIYEHKNNPLVSIIMPVYNMADYVAEAIESVLIQNYMNFELIVVDDGSTDRTRDAVLKFKDPRVKYFYKENGGPYSARNLGTKKARGDFIVPLDADDMITPDYIARHLQEFERCPDADLIYCDDCLIEEDCKPIRVIERREYTDRKLLIRDLFRCGFPIVPFRTCIRKSVFDRIGLFDDGFRNAMDYDMIRRFVKHGLKAHHLKAPLYLRRMTPDSVSRKASDEKVRAHFEVLRRFTESFSYDELFPDVAWDKIVPEMRQLHAKCLVAMTYLAIGQTYVKKNLPIYGKMAFGQACSELRDSLKMDPGNPQIRQLLQKCEFGRQKYDEQLQQHQNITADTLSRAVGLNRTVQMCPTATSVSCGTKEDKEYLVTAIVSTYNSEKFLRGCLDDLEHQTIADKLEIIVVNSGSKQNEDAIVRQYQQKYNNIVYIKTEHRERIYAAWDRAVKAARGRFITNANTDDRHSKDALEIMVSTLQANPDIALVYGDQIQTETTNDTFENHHGTQMNRRPEYSRAGLLFICCVGSQPMWRKSLHNEFGYFDDTLTSAADWDFWLRISSKYKFKHIPEFLGLYYYNKDGIEHGKKIHSLYERYIVGKRYGNPYISAIPLYQSKDNPLVSVIMPAYNAAEYIAEAIESVLIQNYRNFELIVVDDGSTDNTKDIVAGFKDDKIKYFYKENAGPSSARNLGIKKAASDFIVPLDADDMITPDCIARHLQEFERCPDADFIYCDDYWIDVDCKPIQVFERREYTDRKSLIRDLFRSGFPVVPFRTCIRRSVFDKIGFYDDGLSVGEDYDMMRRFVRHGLKAHHLKAPLYLRRMAPDSVSRKISDEKVKAHFEVLRRFTESFSYDELFPDVAWDKIAPESRQLHAKCLAAVTYLAIGQTFIKTHSPVYGKMAFGQACSELRDSLKIDPGNPQIRQLLQKCEFGRQKYDEQILQAVR